MALGLAGLVWISRLVIDLDHRESLSRRQAAQEERIRLALWRMDSALAPLVAQESSRPYFHFRALYPASASYAHMYDRPAPGAAMTPSPLLVAETPQVKLHFQIDPGGRFSSPQVLEGRVAAAMPSDRREQARARLAELSVGLSRESLVARMSAPQDEPVRLQAPALAVQKPARPELVVKAEIESDRLLAPAENRLPKAPAAIQQAEEKAKELEAKGQLEAARTVTEYAARARQQAASNEMAIQQNMPPPQKLSEDKRKLAKSSLAKADDVDASLRSISGTAAAPAPPATTSPVQMATVGAAEQVPSSGRGEAGPRLPAPAKDGETAKGGLGMLASAASPLSGETQPMRLAPPPGLSRARIPEVKETSFSPYWVGERLLLARRVTMRDGEYLQGCWLDWTAIRSSLRKAVVDLLPEADLQPASPGQLEEPGRLLAALPVRLLPGPLPRVEASGLAPAVLVLGIGWACALVAGAAAALLLQQALALGERRGAFVSAVTHELRTPLTTFRMYAELLHLNMVEEESERRALLHTLVVESDRLDHLVKNVLSYARLESGRGSAALEKVPVADLLERGCERLSQRAALAGMKVEIEVPEDLAELATKTDSSVVEQILFNLVDNACKYAASGKDRSVLIQAAREGGRLLLRVKDHGPGIAKADRKKLFRPFHKSAREAARSAPGVGLGLALCRRLALSLGGDLRLEQGLAEGACFVLELPLAGDGRP
jgi:signal transduction histidine kinase